MDALRWRFVGPYRGGRVMAVAGHPTEARTAFFGSTGGGVWKTVDGGASWANLSDRYFKRSSVGAIALASSDPQVLYAGMGECGFRANVTHGDGLYRSRDGGRSWSHQGLAETQNIGRVRVHPHNPELLYVAAMGHRFGPNPERGIYRSADGGDHWQRVLHGDDTTGAIDLAMDPINPRILYAALWQARRYPWGFDTGGPGSGIWKSTDGGESWVDLTDRPGLPRGVKGRIAICVSPVRPERLYALIVAREGGVYRSNDGGESWIWTNADHNFLVRGWYETHITADPLDADTVWLPNRKLWKSTDGGRTFAQLNTSYWDQHDLWVDPRDTRHLVLGNDGGASISYDGGHSWSSVFNQPTAELYHVRGDSRVPYRVYTAQQDSSTLSMPSRSDRGPISEMDWYDVGGGESAHIVVRPDNPDVVFASDLAGVITRYDHRSLQLRDISPWPEDIQGWPARSLPYRFNWSLPLLLSRHDPGVLYAGSNRLFRSRDDGQSWDIISPDLTRHDPETLAFSQRDPDAMHWRDSGEDFDYATIASLAEGTSPEVLWAGSDDGVVSLSRDGGASWADVTPPDLPEWAWCEIEASTHRPGGAYLAATRHRLDDFRPYLYRTDDFGAHWQPIAAGIPDQEFVRVLRADPAREGLLYCGTEAGVYYSPDDGASWRPLQSGLPACSMYDLAVHNGDLLASTHGRGLWILDDLSPLHQLDEATLREPLHLFAPRPAYRLIRQVVRKSSYITMGYPDAEPNPFSGFEVAYSLAERPDSPLTLTLRDPAGRIVATYSSVAAPSQRPPLGPLAYSMPEGVAVLSARGDGEVEAGVRVGMRPRAGSRRPAILPAEAGLNRFVVELRYPGARPLPGYRAAGSTAVPLPPGQYTLELALGDEHHSVPATLLADPRVSATQADFKAQTDLLLRIRDLVDAIHVSVLRGRLARARIASWIGGSLDEDPAAEPARHAAIALQAALLETEEGLVQWDLDERSGELSDSHYPIKLNGKLETLASMVSGADAAPTAQAQAVFAMLSAQAYTLQAQLESLLDTDLAALNETIRGTALPAIPPPSRVD